MAKRNGKSKIKKTARLQKGRQQGSDTGRDAWKSNSQEFFRHPGQGMRGKQGGEREEARNPGQESVGSDTRKHTRPKSERWLRRVERFVGSDGRNLGVEDRLRNVAHFVGLALVPLAISGDKPGNKILRPMSIVIPTGLLSLHVPQHARRAGTVRALRPTCEFGNVRESRNCSGFSLKSLGILPDCHAFNHCGAETWNHLLFDIV
jgi:hypothetical protein